MITYGCRNNEASLINQNNLKKMDVQECELIAGEKIFFGHRSVGKNIIDGIEDITREICLGAINIKETRNIDTIHSPVFAHAGIGENRYPKVKIDDFIELVQSGLSDTLDIAILKFCYIDIDRNTDIQDLFSYYKSALDQIQKEFPRTKFVHMTVPLTTKPTGIKGLIKQLIGYDPNIKRTRYNRLLRKTYDSHNLFDIAFIESTHPDGKRETSSGSVEALVPEYTSDGGHLNQTGRRIVAEQFLLFLAHLDK